LNSKKYNYIIILLFIRLISANKIMVSLKHVILIQIAFFVIGCYAIIPCEKEGPTCDNTLKPRLDVLENAIIDAIRNDLSSSTASILESLGKNPDTATIKKVLTEKYKDEFTKHIEHIIENWIRESCKIQPQFKGKCHGAPCSSHCASLVSRMKNIIKDKWNEKMTPNGLVSQEVITTKGDLSIAKIITVSRQSAKTYVRDISRQTCRFCP
jgi:hypothetical protein